LLQDGEHLLGVTGYRSVRYTGRERRSIERAFFEVEHHVAEPYVINARNGMRSRLRSSTKGNALSNHTPVKSHLALGQKLSLCVLTKLRENLHGLSRRLQGRGRGGSYKHL